MAKVILHGIDGHPQRLTFFCPGCNATMSVCPIRWNWNGSTDKPTLSPSILQTTGPFPDGHKEVCHCFVREGAIEFCGDCTHDKRGIMELPELESVLDIQRNPDGSISWTKRKGGES